MSGPQQSPSSKLHSAMLVSLLQKPFPTKALLAPLSMISPPRHWHSEQYSLFMQEPQQSPPSYSHSGLLVSSLQYPLPTKLWPNVELQVSLWWHTHSEHCSMLTSVPQQSPPSYLQSALLVSSLQNPFWINELSSPTKFPPRQSQMVQYWVRGHKRQQSPPS